MRRNRRATLAAAIKHRSPRRAVAFAALGALAVGGVASATIPGGDGEIDLCYRTDQADNKNGAELRLIDEAKPSCGNGFTRLAINERGPNGEKGDKGDPGTSDAYYARGGGVIRNDTITVVSKNVPAGNYAINAKLSLYNSDPSLGTAKIGCDLNVGTITRDSSLVFLDRSGGGYSGYSENVALQAVVSNFGGGAISVVCQETLASDLVDAVDGVLSAIKVSSVQ